MNVKNPIITSESSDPLGTYSQAIRSGDMVFISAQSPIIPATGEMIKGTVEDHIRQSFENVKAVAIAAGGECDKIVKVTIFLTSLANFSIANKVMGGFFTKPYPARTTIEVSALPEGAYAEIDAIMHLT
ncbi:Rid family detoxifying hydrolase [Candidatus Spongiihabitans sp.]|uniref:Rid family detoxifying hydrolase n=1 Tax=Candidatus Spongiihabitans sp. TaxID=3101308 RepID=UPI003C6FB495